MGDLGGGFAINRDFNYQFAQTSQVFTTFAIQLEEIYTTKIIEYVHVHQSSSHDKPLPASDQCSTVAR